MSSRAHPIRLRIIYSPCYGCHLRLEPRQRIMQLDQFADDVQARGLQAGLGDAPGHVGQRNPALNAAAIESAQRHRHLENQHCLLFVNRNRQQIVVRVICRGRPAPTGTP